MQRRVGLPLVTVLLTWGGLTLARAHYRLGRELMESRPEALPEYLGWAALLGFALWVSLPVIVFPLDENLDPQQLALLPVPGNTLVTGLAAASLVSPAVVVPLLLLAGNGALLASAWWMILPASVVYLGLLAVAGQLLSTSISAVLKSRRGRDLTTLLVLGIALGAFLLYRRVDAAMAASGLAQAVTGEPITRWALLLPPVAAVHAVYLAATGSVPAALAHLAAAVAGLLVLGRVWRALLSWLLATPEQRARPARRARRRGMTAGPWGRVPVMARKELRFYVRDPRQRLVWTGTVIFVGLGVGAAMLDMTGVFDVRGQPWAPLAAPVLALFVGLPIALNLFGWERNAASFLFALPPSPVRILAGKGAAVAIALTLEIALLAFGLAWFSGQWRWMWLVAPAAVAAIGCQLAVGNMVSVLTPLRLPREGTDVFAQSTEQGCLAIASQTVSFFAIGLLLVPPASALVLTVGFGQALPAWAAALVNVVWGAGVYLASLYVAARLLGRRIPEVLSWVEIH